MFQNEEDLVKHFSKLISDFFFNFFFYLFDNNRTREIQDNINIHFHVQKNYVQFPDSDSDDIPLAKDMYSFPASGRYKTPTSHLSDESSI